MPAADLDAWLRSGGLVVTASERAARALFAAFHRARRAEGLRAWPAPAIQSWSEFTRTEWLQRSFDGRLILNSAQEESLWAEIISAQGQTASLLEGPRHRVARLAMEAHALLCAYAPQLLQPRMRSTWQNDAAAFSNWLTAFDEKCRAGNLICGARLPLDLVSLLESRSAAESRPPLLLAGFDRIQPVQRALFDALGQWTEFTLPKQVGAGAPGLDSGTWDGSSLRAHFYEAADTQSELAACAIWCSHRLAANPHARILVVSQDAATRRGEMERAFSRHLGSEALFEFTLGIPVDQVPLAHCAHLLLRWLTTSLAEHEIDWLFASGYAAGPQESSALQSAMRHFRRRNLEQPTWPLDSFLAHYRTSKTASASPAVAWLDRMTQARQRVADFSRQSRAPLDWAEFASQLLESMGWPAAADTPAARPLASAEFQAARRFHQAVETAGSLGFDGRRVSWQDFLSSLARVLDQTLFALESRDTPVQIIGPAESAGLTADAIWFLGANEDVWPASAPTHPLLPVQVQKQFVMPHSSPQLDWDLAQLIIVRLLATAPEVNFTFAHQIGGVESRPSRIIAQTAGAPQPLPSNLAAPPDPAPLTGTFPDTSLIQHQPGKVEGGATVLTYQSQCPFKAFASTRLGAQAWEPAQPSLTPAQRGKLLHAVMHAIWAGPPDGLRNLDQLQNLADLPSFVAAHVRRVFQSEVPGHLRVRMPNAYLELEELRLVRLISDWLNFEATRFDFEVLRTEDKRTIHLAGLTFDLRLDRIDRLNDGSLLVIDYKTGDVTPKSWDRPRPDDVQLPLYAAFALDPELGDLGGLAFAKMRAGRMEFAGRIGYAQGTLLSALSARDALVRQPFTAEMLIDWRDDIERLARDFLAGRAEVNPRDFPKTCERCNLQALCRVHENAGAVELDENNSGPELSEATDE
ncbi:MAG TPA: PD-(D/E)XK nuclease family protein [Terracidiphilus sp.]